MKWHKFWGFICLTPWMMLMIGCSAIAESEPALNVAVFTDSQVVAENCVQATVKILSANGINVKTITGAAIRNGGLNGLDVIMFPGGSGSGEARALGQTGCAAVAQFVKNGGGYIGTCAGGFLGALGYQVKGLDTSATAWLVLANAEIVDPDHWNRGTGEAQVKIVAPNHPILQGFSGSITAHYVNGPLFRPGQDPNLPPYQELAIFESDICTAGGASPGVMPGKTALLTAAYGNGRCVMFSFHPELTPGLDMMVVRAVRWVKGL